MGGGRRGEFTACAGARGRKGERVQAVAWLSLVCATGPVLCDGGGERSSRQRKAPVSIGAWCATLLFATPSSESCGLLAGRLGPHETAGLLVAGGQRRRTGPGTGARRGRENNNAAQMSCRRWSCRRCAAGGERSSGQAGALARSADWAATPTPQGSQGRHDESEKMVWMHYQAQMLRRLARLHSLTKTS